MHYQWNNWKHVWGAVIHGFCWKVDDFFRCNYIMSRNSHNMIFSWIFPTAGRFPKWKSRWMKCHLSTLNTRMPLLTCFITPGECWLLLFLRLKRRIPIVAPDFVSANMLSVHTKIINMLDLGHCFCHLPNAAEILWRSCPRGSCGGVLPHWFQGPRGLRSGRWMG